MTEPPVHVSGDEAHAHPRHTGNRWIDLSLAFAAIFISGVSLAVAIDHGRTERQLVAANSWPFMRAILANGRTDNGVRELAIGASNGGVGPAKVHSVEIFYRGQPVSSPYDLLRRCCGLTSDPQAAYARLHGVLRFSITDETVLRPGEENETMSLVHSGDDELVDRLSSQLTDISFRACYCSVFDECWISDLRSTTVQPVKSCAKPQHPFDPLGR